MRTKLFLLTSLFFSIAILFFALKSTKNESPQVPLLISKASEEQMPELSNLDAPNGKYSLSMKKTSTNDGTSYTFTSKNQETGDETLVFSKILPQKSSMTLPFNSFSPDNKYLFLKEETPNQTNYYVMSATLAPFKRDNLKYLNITDFFTQKYPNYTFQEVTGWADPALLVVNAKNENDKETSLWFDINSNSFIPLSTRFN